MNVDTDRIEADLRKQENRAIGVALDYVANVLNGSVYIEDRHGRLLFSMAEPQPDDWRSNFAPLSTPTLAGYNGALEMWYRTAGTYIAVPGDQSFRYRRTIIPLTYQSCIFSFVHLVNTDMPQVGRHNDAETAKLISVLADKLFMLILGTQNEFRVDGTESYSEAHTAHALSGKTVSEACTVAFFDVAELERRADQVVDYLSIVRRAGTIIGSHFAEDAPEITHVHVYTRRLGCAVELILHFLIEGEVRLTEFSNVLERQLTDLAWHLPMGLSIIDAAESGFDQAEREARAMLSLAQSQQTKAAVLTRNVGGPLSLSLLAEDSRSFRQYAVFIRETLSQADSILFETAKTYAYFECNVSDTAVALAVDRRTVNNRLHKIYDLTGLSLPSFPSKIVLYLAFTNAQIED